jgi:outer membrane protein
MQRYLVPCVWALLAAPLGVRANDLMDLYLLAKDQDQIYQEALAQRDEAVEARPQAWAALLPQMNAQGADNANKLHVLSTGSPSSSITAVDGTTGPTPAQYYGGRSWSVNLTQTVFDWSAFQTVAEASHQVAQAEAALRSAEQTLITRVASAYFTVLSARDTLRADLDAETAFKEQMEQSKSKYDVGLVAITDVQNAKAAYDTAAAQVIADRTALDNARRALGLIVGKHIDEVCELQQHIPLLSPTPESAESWSETARQDSPDLMAARDAAEVARKQISVAQGRYLPTLSIAGSKGRTTQHSDIGDDQITDQIGLNLNWNFLSGGLTMSQVRQAKAGYRFALAQYEQEDRTIDQNTRDDYEGVISGIAGVNATFQAVESNQTSVVATTAGLLVGTRTEIDVVNARQALAAAEKAYYQARYTYLGSALSLKLDAGHLTEAGLAEVDNLLVTERAPASEPSSALPLPAVDPAAAGLIPGVMPTVDAPASPAATPAATSNPSPAPAAATPAVPPAVPPATTPATNLATPPAVTPSIPLP